jgi:hypothetical protein
VFFIPGINGGTIMSEASIKLEAERLRGREHGASLNSLSWRESASALSVKTRLRSQRVPIEHAGLLANSHVNPRFVLDRTLEH